MALSMVLTQLEADWPAPAAPTLGFVYLTDHHAPHAAALLAGLRQRWPQVQWVGTVGVGVAASGVEYFDEPALSLLLCDLPPAHFRVFSGRSPWPAATPAFRAQAALVHAEGHTPDLGALVADLSERTEAGYLFGGLVASRRQAWQIGNGLFEGGLSGVAWGEPVRFLSRVTQGSQPIGPARRITRAREHVVLELDGRPAFDALLEDLGLADETPSVLVPRLHGTLAGLTQGSDALIARPGQFGTDTLVRHLIGVDPRMRAVAVAHPLEEGMQLAFCRRDVDAARRDLVRICTELRDAVETRTLAAPAWGGDEPAGSEPLRMAGALYISCAGRGGPHFGAPSAELKIIQHALGDVPLAGFFAGGEIGHRHVYGYTGVLTVFLA
jgi:small ligand-binding sensory domain FIST